jgi:hypothetical protein
MAPGVMRAACLFLAIALAACGGDELRVAGPPAYVRCLAAEPPASRTWSAGTLRLALEERTLRIEGAPEGALLAAFTGPVDRASIRTLRAVRPLLALMVGGLGATRAEAEASLGALADLGAPVLFVAGGTDTHAALAALDDGGPVVDASRLRSIRIGQVELVPVAGAPLGRYAASDDACGFGQPDAHAIADALGAKDGSRYLVTWAAPRGGGPLSRGLLGTDAGSALVEEVADRTGAAGWIAAWPSEHAGEASTPLRAVVAPLSGAWVERADGTRAPPDVLLFTLRGAALAPRAP